MIGDRFTHELFDTKRFFDASPDRGGSTVLGPVAEYTYRSGTCRFELNPARIILAVRDEEVVPQVLTKAGAYLGMILDEHRSVMPITALGFNCDTTLERQSGVELSNRMLNMDLFEELSEAEQLSGRSIITFQRDDVQYFLRIEPDVNSQGRNLFVAVNAHQTLSPDVSLESALRPLNKFAKYAKKLYARIDDELT